MKQLIIETDGRAYIRHTDDQPVILTRALAESLAGGASVSIRHAAMLAIYHGAVSPLHLTVESTRSELWVARLRGMRFLSCIRSRAGVVSPDFTGSGSSVSLEWVAPMDMKLLFAVSIYKDVSAKVVDKCYLLATDDSHKAYRLPTANVHDDCGICTGRFDNLAPDSFSLVMKAYKHFCDSEWNGDLYRDKSDEEKAKTESMFHWLATDTGFDQQPFEGDWRTLCHVVGNDMTGKIINTWRPE